jgi:hypothetical protein
MVLMKWWDEGRAVDPIRIQGFDDPKRTKKNKAKIFLFFLSKIASLQLMKA